MEVGISLATNHKGYCVLATTDINTKDFVCCYEGELLGSKDGEKRFREYPADVGSYMLQFRWKEQTFFIDATNEKTNKLGRFINHSRTPNVVGRLKVVGNTPKVYFEACRQIPKGSELLLNYGDNSRSSRQAFPWLLDK